jgi:hypothetical protein
MLDISVQRTLSAEGDIFLLACFSRSFGRAKGDEEGGFMIGIDKQLGD